MLGTGGTIGSAGDYWGGNTTRVPIEELLKVPGIDSIASVETEQFLNVGYQRLLTFERPGGGFQRQAAVGRTAMTQQRRGDHSSGAGRSLPAEVAT